jgi:alpha-mannosidase
MLIAKVEGRIEQYAAFLERAAYLEREALAFEVYQAAPDETRRVPPEDVAWRPVETPYPWGQAWSCCWFRARFRALDGGRPLFIRALPNADTLAFIDGVPAGAFNLFHKKLRVEADGAEHLLHLEAYSGHPYAGCGPFEGESVVVTIGKTLPAFPNTFEGGALLERQEAVYGLFYDVRALFDLAKKLDDSSLRKARILKGLYDALMEEVSLNAAGAELEAAAARARARIAPLLAAKNGDTCPRVFLAGHAHIDHAWLWHIGESERKIARTYSNMARFAAEYPEFVFIQSQPCQLAIVRREYPAVFDAVKAAFKKGAWEPNGGMWVEADCNIPSGESLVRQFLVGKAFTKEALGYEADTLWLPDVFGYAAALPQILAGCRIKHFVTSKIGWNDTTRFPYDTFIWRGIDGTGIKTHFVSSRFTGYNGHVTADELLTVWADVQHKEVQGGFVRSIGEGDGGGGTLRSDLEMARRYQNLEGMPQTRWMPVSRALAELFAEAENLPEWRGELYLELHRGTYTSQARTKRWNRRIEFALRHVEWLAALADGGSGAGAPGSPRPYPAERLLEAWKQLLTLQFHDIIPGSSITRVYAEAEAVYRATDGVLEEMAARYRQDVRECCGAELVLFNDLSWERRGPVWCAAAALGDARPEALRAADGGVVPVQYAAGLDGEPLALCFPPLPSMGWRAFSAEKAAGAASGGAPFRYEKRGEGGAAVLETPLYRVRFDECARMVSFVVTASGRELVRAGGFFNAFVGAEDVPVFWSAWDLDADWTKSAAYESALVSAECAASGALCCRLRLCWRIGRASRLTQDMVFYAENARVDFDTKVDWQERQRLLKVEFDTALDARSIRCETQYGHHSRGVERNTLHDRARFEICAHKWVALEEAGAGIALLNDSKYGFDVEGGRLRMSLLRAPIAPDAEADRGEQRFVYALLPFTPPFAAAPVVEAAYELNSPAGIAAGAPRDVPAGTAAAAPSYSLCAIAPPSGGGLSPVIVECVKAPEDGGGGLVLRLYESRGGAARARLCFARQPVSCRATDMLEENGEPIPVRDGALELDFRPFEIKTLRVRFEKEKK